MTSLSVLQGAPVLRLFAYRLVFKVSGCSVHGYMPLPMLCIGCIFFKFFCIGRWVLCSVCSNDSVVCSDMTTTMALLTSAHRQDKCVSHALQIRAAWALSNYHRFFRLYLCAPRMSGYIIDWFLERERKQALKIMIKSYVLFQFFFMILKIKFPVKPSNLLLVTLFDYNEDVELTLFYV